MQNRKWKAQSISIAPSRYGKPHMTIESKGMFVLFININAACPSCKGRKHKRFSYAPANVGCINKKHFDIIAIYPQKSDKFSILCGNEKHRYILQCTAYLRAKHYNILMGEKIMSC